MKKTGPYMPFDLEYDEGWAVFENDDGTMQIQRLDSPQDAREWHPAEPLFDSDEAAVAYVLMRAEAGSQYHLEALRLVNSRKPV
jgi:hypothetical protein